MAKAKDKKEGAAGGAAPVKEVNESRVVGPVHGEGTPETRARQGKRAAQVPAIPPKAPPPPAVNPENLIAMAIEKNVPLDSLERLLAMRRELKEEQAKEAYFAALAGFQTENPPVPKTHAVMEKKEREDAPDEVRYYFAPIEDVVNSARPFLDRWGFSFRWETVVLEGKVLSTCIATHKDGHSERSTFEVPIDASAHMSIQQKVASARTFSNRYSMMDAFGIVTVGEDDDGAGAWKAEADDAKVRIVSEGSGKAPKAKEGVKTGANGVKVDATKATQEAKDLLSETYRLCSQYYDEGWHPLFIEGTDRPLTKAPGAQDPRGPFHRLFTDIELEAMAKEAHGKDQDAEAMKKLNDEWLKALKKRSGVV